MKYRDVIFALLVSMAFTASGSGDEFVFDNAPAQVCFSPGGGCTKLIVNAIGRASREILVQAYSFTSSPIRSALIEASKRGIKVAVILDPGEPKEEQFKTADIFSQNNVSVYIDDKHYHAHDKVMIIDGETVITGSFNFTYAAENSNAENLLLIKSRVLADKYSNNWKTHRQHSPAYKQERAKDLPRSR